MTHRPKHARARSQHIASRRRETQRKTGTGDGVETDLVRLRECGDKRSAAGERIVAVDHAFEEVHCVTLVVAADERVRVVHARAVHGEPVDHADRVSLCIVDRNQRHVLVDIVLVKRSLPSPD